MLHSKQIRIDIAEDSGLSVAIAEVTEEGSKRLVKVFPSGQLGFMTTGGGICRIRIICERSPVKTAARYHLDVLWGGDGWSGSMSCPRQYGGDTEEEKYAH